MSRSEMSTSFGKAASDYERGRPTYPPEAVDWILDTAPRRGKRLRVLDIGAGTGKLTRALVDAGYDVVALDPDPLMLMTLGASVPGVPAVAGRAESIPAGSESFDAAVAGQVWHWVDPESASREVWRILRPAGTLGLIWNTRDTSVPWVSRMTEIMHQSRAEEYVESEQAKVSGPFAPLQRAVFTGERSMTRDDLFAMARSRSYVITADLDSRTRMDSELGQLFDDLGLKPDATVALPYLTHAFRTVKSAT